MTDGQVPPAPLIPGCVRVERHVTARGASAEELDSLGLPRYAILPVVVYQALQYDQDNNVLAVTSTVVRSQHQSPDGWELSSPDHR